MLKGDSIKSSSDWTATVTPSMRKVWCSNTSLRRKSSTAERLAIGVNVAGPWPL